MKQFLSLAFLFLLIGLFSGCGSDEPELSSAKDLSTFLSEEREDQNIPALSALIFKEGEILYEEYFGESNLEKSLPLEEDHMFLLASVSKVVTATALLRLYDEGKFELDDKINDYLPFKVDVPGAQTAITFKMLLTHTSGIADGAALDDQYYYGEDSPVALGDFLKDYLSPDGQYYDENDNFHNFEPGAETEYSNVGNALIGLLVEELSGESFDTYCQKNIFDPLEMQHTSWRLESITAPLVQPYTYTRGGHEAIQHYTFTDYPNGGLRSTAKDLFRFFNAFVQGGFSDGYQLLEGETITEMRTPQIPDIDEETGLHLFLMDEENNLWGHDGGEQGVATIAAFNPTTKVGVILLCNEGEADLDAALVEAYLIGLKL